MTVQFVYIAKVSTLVKILRTFKVSFLAHFLFLEMKMSLDRYSTNLLQIQHLNLYKKIRKIVINTSTLLIHNLKYLSAVSFCFTTRKINVRV